MDQSRNALDWLLVGIAVVLVLVYLYRWWRGGGGLPLGLAATLSAAGLVYFSRFWEPILYLLVTVLLSVATVAWIWLGQWQHPAVQAAILLHVAFTVVSVYLFNYEEPGLPPESEPE